MEIVPKKYSQMHYTERRELREQYTIAQQGKCYHCKGSLRLPPPDDILEKRINWDLFPGGEGFLRYPIHLHHCHKTDDTIGAVHSYCNCVLFQYYGE